MKQIKLTTYEKFQDLWSRLSNTLPEKAVNKSKWKQPPKEYKSSPYRIWANCGEMIDVGNGTKVSGYVIYFRDDRDYTFARLME